MKKGKSKGILTVEAALVLPIFLFAILTFCYLFRVMELQLKLQSALNQAAQQTASYGYLLGRLYGKSEQKTKELLGNSELFSAQGLFSVDEAGEGLLHLVESLAAESALKQMVVLSDALKESDLKRIVGGIDGICFQGSRLRDEERCVVVVAEYQIKLPFFPSVISKLPVRQTAVSRLFCGDRDYKPEASNKNGDADGDETKRVYYVTPNGTVYHTTKACSYLRFSVHSTSKEQIGGLRNKSGGKYYSCARCAKGRVLTDILFYTEEGSSYHLTEQCSSLKRTILEVTEEELAGKPPCSRCGGNGG